MPENVGDKSIIKGSGYDNIKRMDIWNYLKVNKWRSSVDLTISDMVNDIIHVDNKDIDIYVKSNNS